MPRLLRTDDIRRYLQDKKGEIKERSRRWSMCSDSSDCSAKSNTSLRSLPQYSSYRAFSSQGSVQGSINKMSGLPTPKSKSTKVVPRGHSTASKDSRSSTGIPTPGAVSRENSFTKSQLPVFKREVSTPNMRRESSIPQIKREDSMPQIKTSQKTPSRPSSAQPPLRKEIPSVMKREGSLSQIKKGASGVVRPRSAASTPPFAAPPSDMLKVGDRVNISGSTKKGVIQYVGETRFAKGDWAGVVLDEAVGKNDGTVAGIRYFQCQPNYGVFVKVDKLTKLADVSDPNYKPHSSTTPDVDRTSKSKVLSTPKMTPVRAAENTEIPDNLKVGNKVSIGEAKVGHLRYLGETGFAKGIWCGVELLEPLGKNDGAVAGTRYFQCDAKFGLFAPAHKVKKLDDGIPTAVSTEPKPEVKGEVISPERAEPEIENVVSASINETVHAPDSKVTETLVTSSVSSIQMKLQDQDNEIQKLQKDRELDKSEYQTLLEQYQQSENKLTSMRITQDKLQRENEDEVKRLQSMLSNADKVKASYEMQLEEEKRKLEDLQFQLEEQMVSKELSSESDREKARMLEEQLESRDGKIQSLENEVVAMKQSEEELQNRYSDLEFQLAETNEKDIQSSQSMSVLQDKLKSLEEALYEAQNESNSQNDNLTGELEKREAEVNTLKEDLKIKEEANNDLEFQIKKYRDELRDTIESKGALNKEIFDLTSQLKVKESENSEILSSLENLKSENGEFKVRVKNAETKIENLSTEKLKLEEEVSNLAKSSGDSSSQMAYVNEQLKETKREYTVLQDEKSSLSIKVETLLQDIEELKERSSKEKASLEREKEESVNKLQETINALNESVKVYAQKQAQLEEELLAYSKKQQDLNDENRKIENQLGEKDELLKAKESEILELTTKHAEATTSQSSIQEQLEKLKEEHEKKSNELKTLSTSKLELDEETVTLKTSYESLEKEFNELKTNRKSIEEKCETVSEEKEILSHELANIKKNLEKKDVIIHELELEKTKIEDKKKSVDLECVGLSETNKELQNQLQFSQDENHILKENISQMEANLSQGSSLTGKLQHDLSIMKEEVAACKGTIGNLESTNKKLETRCECLNEEKVKAYMESNSLLSQKATLEEELKSLKKELQETIQRETSARASLESDRVKLQDSVETSLSQLQQKEGELSSWRVKAHNLEKKVAEQEQQIQTLESSAVNVSIQKSDNVVNGMDDGDLMTNKLKEELENKSNEVMFLNSVVVELQNKFKASEAKVRLLEDGPGLFSENIGLDDTMSPVRPGVKQRMFCDICDEFDLHETEDCPTQSSMDDVGTQYHAARGEERPYCTTCEVFGHSTEDCDDEETF